MAPEQITNPKGVDLRTDIYGLGVTLYCMVTGGTPFETRTTMEVVHDLVAGNSAIPKEIPNVHPAVAALIHKMTAANPDDRHPSADEVLVDLKRCERAIRNPGAEGADDDADSGGDNYAGKYETSETMDSSEMLQVLLPKSGPNPWLLWGGVVGGTLVLAGLIWMALS